MKNQKIKKVLKTTLKVVWIIFVGVMTFSGVQGLIIAWGFRGDGWIGGIGGLMAIYVMVVVWSIDHRKVFNL